MANEPDVIHQQMRDTHAALKHKLETLERQVTGTIQEVSTTVENVKDAVHDTVESVKDSVTQGAQALRDAFDLERQTRRHPWLMFGGAMAFGYLGGSLIGARRSAQSTNLDWSQPRANGESSSALSSQESTPAALAEPSHAATSALPGWLSQFTERFRPEIEKLEGVAIGAIFGVARDLIHQNVPDHLRPHLDEVIDGIAQKMGARPIEGPPIPRENHRPGVTV
jgi:hypothetical protein